MGINNANLDYYMNDSMVFEFKKTQFERGYLCECGEEISSENFHKKTTCTSNEALTNHIIFPTLSLLKTFARPSPLQKVPRNWALLVQLHHVKKRVGIVTGFTHLQEYIMVNLQHVKNDLSDLKTGYTLAILNPEVGNDQEGVYTVKRSDSCYIFKEAMSDVQLEADKLLNDSDLLARNGERDVANVCFGCGLQCKDMKRCGGCKLAKYCSQQCQLKSWVLSHKKLCPQSETLLRLACLPRQQTNEMRFTFQTEMVNSLPPYVYNEEFIQKSFYGILIYEECRIVKTISRPTEQDKCGLCGKSNQQAFLVNERGLTKTNCCSNWVCNDEHTYKLQSFLENSCFRNHNRYTMCASHYQAKHLGEWKNCNKCKLEHDKLSYEEMCTNKHNFEKLFIVNKEEMRCYNCGFKSFDMSDFAGSNLEATPCSCCARKRIFFCKKVACKSKGGFSDVVPGQTHMVLASLFPKESDQRVISVARSGGFTPSSAAPLAQIVQPTVDELCSQAEKLFKKSRFSPTLRVLSLAIDKIFQSNKSIEVMTKPQRVTLIQVYTRRAECYMRMAERFNKMRYANLASDDTLFVLKNDILLAVITGDFEVLGKPIKIVKMKSDEFIATRDVSTNNSATTRTNNNNNNNGRHQRRNNNRRTRNNNRHRQQRSENKENQEEEEDDNTTRIDEEECPLLAYTCSKLKDSNLAINALTDDDQCPICQMQWINFVEPTISVILPCSHACCAPCLLKYQQACLKSKCDDIEDRQSFACILCRKKLSNNLLEEIARQVVAKRLIVSLNEFARRLPFSVDEFNDTVVSLLVNSFKFDVSQVENALFNMVGLVDSRDPNEQLNHDTKQEFYKTARAPVIKLQEEYTRIRDDLNQMNDTDSFEWKRKRNELDEVQKKLIGARRNAASDIFERTNSRGNMGALIEYIQDGVGEMALGQGKIKTSVVHVDFHGLHVNEAKERIDEFVLPILPALKKIIVITGHGVHNESGCSVLKEELRKYFGQNNLKCEDLKKNKGALCVQV